MNRILYTTHPVQKKVKRSFIFCCARQGMGVIGNQIELYEFSALRADLKDEHRTSNISSRVSG